MRPWALVSIVLIPFAVHSVERLTLAEAARRVVARSPGLRAADAQLDEARLARSEARAGHYPRLDAGSALTRGDGPVYAFSSLLDQRKFGPENLDIDALNNPGYVTNIRSYLRLGVPLFSGFDTRHREDLADLGFTQAQTAATGARQDLRLIVWEVGLQVLQSRALSQMLAERILASTEEVTNAQRLRSRGLVLGSDFVAAEAVLSGLKAWRLKTEKMAQAGQDSLAILLGQDPSRFRLVGELKADGPPLPSLAELWALAGVNRADLRSAEVGAKQAQMAAAQQKAAFLPRVDAMAQAETNTEDFSSNPGARLIMLRAEWALGDPNYGARKNRAAAAARGASQYEEAIKERTRVDILQALRRYEGARDVLPILETTVEKAARSLDLFRPLYQEGRQSILDVLRAEEALARAQSQYLEALGDLHLYRARALAAAGSLDEGALAALSAALEK